MRLFILLMLGCGSVHAAVISPPCKPAEVGGTGSIIYHAANKDGWAMKFFCDENHRWHGYGSAGFWSDVPGDILDRVKAFFTTGTAADVDAYIAQLKCSLSDPTCPQAPMKPLFDSIPLPNYWPPSGLVTQTTVAYKRSESVGGYTYKPLGTVMLGIVCDESTYDQGYFVIPRSSVTLTNKYDTYPLNVYGRCQ